MDWTTVGLDDLAIGLQQAEFNNLPRPLGDFVGKFSTPKNQTKLLARIKCNLYYYRTNYAILFVGTSVVFFIRNPLGAISLALLSAGFLSLNDSFAIALGDKIMSVIKMASSSTAAKIRSQPGGHNGLAVPPGRMPTLKIAGQDRVKAAASIMLSGSVAVFLTGALGTLCLGGCVGTALVLAHASFRSPNLKAKFSQTRRRVGDVLGGDMLKDYGL